MYKCNVCGHTQEEAGEHCGQQMVMVETEAAPDQTAMPAAPSESSSEDSEGGQQQM
ncbi:MAG: hypothetical protein AAB461_01755 [Patescibacteria group bacterium]